MTIETALEILFAASIVVTAIVLAGAALGRIGVRVIAIVSGSLCAAATAAWVAFALDPERNLAISAAGITACVLAALGATAFRKGLESRRQLDDQLAEFRAQIDRIVEQELRGRSEELEHALVRLRADSLSSFVDEERRLADERRALVAEAEQQGRAELMEALAGVQRQIEQRLAAWSADLDRAREGFTKELAAVTRRQKELISTATARMNAESERLSSVDEEQRRAIARLRSELTQAAEEAKAAAVSEIESHAVERRRALHEIGERLRHRERDIGQRIEREHAEAARRIQTTFADVERRQVEQLERILERATSRFSDAATQQFDRSIKTAREEAAQRLARELDRSVQMFAREGESLLAERLAQVGDAGGVRLEKKLAQVAAALERQRDEFVSVTERRLTELDADLRARLAALAADENAERAALEARLQELGRRIDATLARAEERLTSLQTSR